MGIRILLLNVHSACNAGDNALTFVTVQQLKQVFPDCRFTLVVDDPSNQSMGEMTVGSIFTWLHGIGLDRRPHWSLVNLALLIPMTLIPALLYKLLKRKITIFTLSQLRPLLNAYLDSDLVVSVPGGFLYSSGSGIILILQAYSLAIAALAGKPVYLFPQSIGPFRHPWECLLIRGLFKLVRVVMVREAISIEQLKRCNISHPRFHLLPDIAFAFQGLSHTEGQKWLSAHGINTSEDQPLLGMTTLNWEALDSRFEGQEVYESALRNAAKFFIETYKGKVIFLPQVTGPYSNQDDRVPARRVVAKLEKSRSSILLVEEPLPPDLLKALFGCLDILIGTRMHSNIFAIGECIPVIAIGYQYKTRGIAQTVRLEDWVMDINSINSQSLIERLEALMTHRQEVKTQIQTRLPDILKKASQAGAIVAEDFSIWRGR